jgi:hypothetical protein
VWNIEPLDKKSHYKSKLAMMKMRTTHPIILYDFVRKAVGHSLFIVIDEKRHASLIGVSSSTTSAI